MHLEELSKANQPTCDWQTADDLLQETMQRLTRRKYLIVSGLPEHASGNPQERKEKDSEAIAQIASKLGINDLQPSEVSRIGRIGHSKPRLLRFKCDSIETKMALLNKSKDLRRFPTLKSIYTNPDLTRNQGETNRTLRQELKKRKEACEDVIIRRGRVISIEEEENFRKRF